MGLLSYGISVTTLEEVFIKIAQGTHTNATAARGRDEFVKQRSLQGSSLQADAHRSVSAVDPESGLEMQQIGKEAGNEQGFVAVSDGQDGYRKIPTDAYIKMFFRHIYATLLKRFLVFKRDIRSFVFLYFVPVAFLLIGVLIVALVDPITYEPSKTLGFHMYNYKVSNNYMPIPYSNASIFCNSGICSHPTGQSDVFDKLSQAANLPLLAVSQAETIYNMSDYLFQNRNVRQASTFGAFSIIDASRAGSSSIRNLEYVIHGNYTAVHAIPVFQNIIINGLVASYSPAVTVTGKIHPLPFTKQEAGVQVARNVDNIATFVLLAIPYVAASFASFMVREREVSVAI